MSHHQEFNEGDHVSFNLGANVLSGTIEEKLTEPAFVGDRIAHASKSEPRYAVHYEKTGTDFIRTGDALTPEKSTGHEHHHQHQHQQHQDQQQHETNHSPDHFRVGDSVSFNLGRNELHGTVEDVITDNRHHVGDRTAHGTKDDPKLAIHYDATGTDFIRDINKVHHS